MGQVPNTNATKTLEVHGAKKRGQQPRNQAEAGVDTNNGEAYKGKGF
jgi:hypothetical protein